jgi:hypothetical protein
MALAVKAEIVSDNEEAAQAALGRGDYLQAFLLVHVLVEALLRAFLLEEKERTTFNELIKKYAVSLEKRSPTIRTFVDELTHFNQRRNRIVHSLWVKGYSHTNKQVEEAAFAAVAMYSLFIEFLLTYDSDLASKGFTLNNQ